MLAGRVFSTHDCPDLFQLCLWGQIKVWPQLRRMINKLLWLNNLFRVLCSCPQAPWEIEDKKPSSDWPTEGNVEFKDYSVRYREGLDLVLKNLNLSVKGGEKVCTDTLFFFRKDFEFCSIKGTFFGVPTQVFFSTLNCFTFL